MPKPKARACFSTAHEHGRATLGHGTQSVRTYQNTSDGHYSHSIVAGGLLDTSYTTRFTPCTSLMIRFDIRPSSS